ncbi:MAG TPA: acetyl-CoA carboxylase biotin carboxyl carrier protein [Thermoanaerobaculia bacterium]|nr:acetyl-CoA carboxylase biotin carboxyl carrier protein [Thermoanaerobaculia bacterium]
MNFKEILELIDKVAERGIAAVEIERAGTRVRIEGKHAPSQAAQPDAAVAAPAPSAAPARTAGEDTGAPKAAETEAESEAGLHIITSPIVGTFYRSANPESDAFASVGDRVSKGKVLCIIEAMKLMNEIESDADGTLVKIYPQNGQPVEYGEKLFAVRI